MAIMTKYGSLSLSHFSSSLGNRRFFVERLRGRRVHCFQNWGDKPFSAAVQSWYWGHGTMGPYNLVWFDAIDHNGVESVSGYVLKDGEVVGSTCDALAVRPVGTPYPPTLLSLDPDQYTIKMKLNDGTKLSATVSTVATQINVVEYIRWIGTIEGTVGDEAYTGSALWEEFRSKLA